jgi:hypothetical protein
VLQETLAEPGRRVIRVIPVELGHKVIRVGRGILVLRVLLVIRVLSVQLVERRLGVIQGRLEILATLAESVLKAVRGIPAEPGLRVIRV